MMHDKPHQQRVNTRRHIIHHDTEPAMQFFQLPRRPGLHNIEKPEECKGQQHMPNLDR